MFLPNIIGTVFKFNFVVRCGEGSRNDIPVSFAKTTNGPVSFGLCSCVVRTATCI